MLNPLARIDQHIMDDSDLAGPILFFLLFGFFLLFVRDAALSSPPSPWSTRRLTTHTVRQGPLWLHLRPRAAGQHLAARHPLAHVAARGSVRAAAAGRTPLELVVLVDADALAVRVGAGLLPATARADEPDRHRGAHGRAVRVRADDGGDCVVHEQLERHVLRRGPDERHARPGRIPAGAVLRGLRHHGRLCESGDGPAGGECYEKRIEPG